MLNNLLPTPLSAPFLILTEREAQREVAVHLDLVPFTPLEHQDELMNTVE